MRLKRMAALIGAVLLTVITTAAAVPKVVPSTHKVEVNGRAVSPQAYNIDGYNYFKLRDIAFLLNGTSSSFNVTWSGSQQAVNLLSGQNYSAVGGEMTVAAASTLRVQQSTAVVLLDGDNLSIKGYTINGNNYYKIADVAAAMSFTAAYDSATKTVKIKTEDQPEPTPEPNPEPVPEPELTPGIYRVKVSGFLTVRAGPGTSYAMIGKLMDGDRITVDDISNGWAHIAGNTDGASTAYCSADYLVRIGDLEAEPPDGQEPEPEPKPPRTSHIDGQRLVILDAGHGGSDIGAHNADLIIDEKHVNLYVAQYLQQYLEAEGMHVVMVRDSLEEGSSLSLRGRVMEQYAESADLFFSIHHNAANTTARGSEVLAQISDREGGPGQLLGELLLEEYRAMGLPIRGIVYREGSQGDYYYTNRAAAELQIPAVTSEFCFIDNEEDEKFIDSEEDWQAQARAQCNAIIRYFEQVEY